MALPKISTTIAPALCLTTTLVISTGVEAATKKASATAASTTTGAWKTMTVKASSYTLNPSETRPHGDQVGAFGDVLAASKKVIAVSPDLLKAGLKPNSRVRIEGLPGVYTVMDKMHRRWREKIDVLFAKRKRALAWGVQTVTIRYRGPKSD